MRSTGVTAVLPRSGIATHLMLAFFFAVVMPVSGQIAFPLWFTPVPVTLQVMAVILAGLVLGSRWGAISQLQYLAIGAMGLPVFAGFKGGPMSFAGPTGGYLLGFVLGAFVTGWVFERLGGRKTAAWCGGIAGIAAIHFMGASWLAVWMSALNGQIVSLHSVLAMGVAPFVCADLLKAGAASAIALGGRRGTDLIRGLMG